jgi:L-lactate permease
MRTTNYQSGEVTELAVALDRAMASNASALVAYARIYGSSWSPLAPDCASVRVMFTGSDTSANTFVATPSARKVA